MRRKPFCYRLISDQRGTAVIPAVLIGAIVSIMLAGLFARDSGNLNQVGNDQRRDRSIQTAEDGIEKWSVLLSDPVVASLGTGTDDDLPAAFESWSKREKRDWVVAHAADEAVTDTPEGEWAVVKPTGGDDCTANPAKCVVFSVGYIPSRANTKQLRVVRIDYDLTKNVAINHAILTDGDLKINGNPVLDVGPSGAVHSNGNNYPAPPVSAMEVSGNPLISGALTTSGTCTVSGNPVSNPPGCQSSQPEVAVPLVNPRNLHNRAQYDMCPDGRVRKAPAYPGLDPPPLGSTPCLDPDGAGPGDQYLLGVATVKYRGWKWLDNKTEPGKEGAIWDYVEDTKFDGVYYFYKGMAKVQKDVGATGGAWQATLIAEATGTGSEPNHCPHTGGDIQISGSPKIEAHPSAGGILFAAGRDVEVSGNPATHITGLIVAHEQFKINGDLNYTGGIISNDYCATNGSPVDQNLISSNPHITNPGNLEVDLGTAIVRIVRWLEI